MRRVQSFGGGTQSLYLYFQWVRGLRPNPPEAAFFSRIHNAEMADVYRWMEIARREGGDKIPIIEVDGGDLRGKHLAGLSGERFASAPFFVKPPGKVVTDYSGHEWIVQLKEEGKLYRQCTVEHKILPVREALKRYLGYGPDDEPTEKIEMVLGMSADEIQRVKPSQVPWIVNVHPLVTEGEPVFRYQCEAWLRSLGYGDPPRSACIECPLRSDHEWQHMKQVEPESFQRAVEFDRAMRHQPKLKGEAYLHRSMKPLEEIDFDPNPNQLNLFGNECEGYCGV